MSRQIAVIGLGLIGGSIAMGLKEFEDFKRVGVDVSQPTLRYALEQGIVDQVCEDPREALAQADLVFLCMHPRGIQEFLSEHRDHFRPGSLVTDVCGVKGAIVDAARTLPSSVSFLGGHPMAGTEFSGIQHALPNMFQGAHYILTPDEGTQPEHLALMERVARHLGCADVVRTTPEHHDAIIAYTSQLMHVVAVAVCDGIEAACGVRPQIKWTNDLVLNGKKLCGILTELGLESESNDLDYLITGIGINVNHTPEDFDAEVQPIATSLAQELGHPVRRAQLAVEIIRALDRMYAQFPQNKQDYLERYRADCLTVGKQVQLITPAAREEAFAVAIDDDFRLVVEYPDGRRAALSAGEVSVRGMYGYV